MPHSSGGARSLAKPAGAFHHGDLRRALLEGAMRLLERDGPLGIGLRAVARLAGVSHGAPYRHFADKETMLAALAEEGFRELERRNSAAVAAHPADPHEALLALAENYVSFAAERPNLFRLMFGPMIRTKGRFPGVREAGMRAYHVALGAILTAQRVGLLRDGDPAPLALAYWSCLQGVSSLLVDGALQVVAQELGPPAPMEAKRLARVACEALLTGLRPPPAVVTPCAATARRA